MTIAELREELKGYDDEQFVHMRVWIDNLSISRCYDMVVDKVQAGVDGAMLITGTLMVKDKSNNLKIKAN